VGLLGFGGLHDVEQSLEESSDLSRLGAGAILRALLYQVINDYCFGGRRAAPSLRPGQVMGMDNLSSHKGSRVRELIEQRGCELIYLPPYSPISIP
jgi:DDE superfamily endonuclease